MQRRRRRVRKYLARHPQVPRAGGRRAEQALSPPCTNGLRPVVGSDEESAGISSRRRGRARASHFRAVRRVGKMNACVFQREPRAKDLAMLTPSTPVPTPFSNDTTNTAKSARVEASARSAFRNELRVATAHEAHLADTAATVAAARQAAMQIPDPMTSLSTVAVAGAMNSLPAALEHDAQHRDGVGRRHAERRRPPDAAVRVRPAHRQGRQHRRQRQRRRAGADSRPRTTTSARTTPRTPGARTATTTARTLTQTVEAPKETVQYQPVERTTTSQGRRWCPTATRRATRSAGRLPHARAARGHRFLRAGVDAPVHGAPDDARDLRPHRIARRDAAHLRRAGGADHAVRAGGADRARRAGGDGRLRVRTAPALAKGSGFARRGDRGAAPGPAQTRRRVKLLSRGESVRLTQRLVQHARQHPPFELRERRRRRACADAPARRARPA